MADRHSLYCRVRGRVQGVGFRYYIYEIARALKVVGYVRNCSDRTVEVYAVGSRERLDDLRRAAATGPHGAYVTACEVTWGVPSESENAGSDSSQPEFRIRY
jgi:acylphosphatase